jgi:redox-sensitive bicupin YhaK (pirin superfamily)
VRLKAGNHTELTLPAGHNTGIVLLRGSVSLNVTERLQGEAQLAILSADGERVMLGAKEDTILLVLTGKRIDEPVVSYGPFVMNTREEIMQAVQDYNAGKMGHLH